MQSAVFDPLLLAVNLHPTPLTWDISIVGAFLLGAAAAYLFGRILGLGVVPAVVSSAAFSLSGWFFLYSNNQFSRSYIFLPVLFLLVELTLRSRRLWPVFGLGVAVAGNIHVGMPEASLFVIGAAAVYAAMRLVQQRSDDADPRLTRSTRRRRLAGPDAGLAARAPVPAVRVPVVQRAHAGSRKGIGGGSVAGASSTGSSRSSPATSAATPRNWFGVEVGISALVALSGRTETKRLHAWLFLALGGFLLAKIYDFGVLGWVGRLPVASQVVFPVFAPPVVSFAFAVLAGIGVQVLWNHDLRLRRFLTLLAAALTALVAFWLLGDHWPVITSALYSQSGLGSGQHSSPRCPLLPSQLASRVGRRWAALLLAGFIVVELFVLAPFRIYAKRADPYRTPGWMALVRTAQEAEPYSRVFGIDDKLYPNTAGALGLQDIRVLDALYVERYWRYVRTFIAADGRSTGSRRSDGSCPALFQEQPDVRCPRRAGRAFADEAWRTYRRSG